MLDAAKEAVEFAAGESRANLDGDRKLTLAIIKSIEIIGEAAPGLASPIPNSVTLPASEPPTLSAEQIY